MAVLERLAIGAMASGAGLAMIVNEGDKMLAQEKRYMQKENIYNEKNEHKK